MANQADIVANAEFAAKYLARFGYLPDVPPAQAGPQHVTESPLMQFQAFAGLPLTGMLDAETLDKMRQPRCGCADISKLTAELARWRKNRLTYFVEKYVPESRVSVEDQQLAIRKAFNDWEAACDIKFTRINDRAAADLIISIGSGPADNFDGPGKTLAWAFLPNGNDGQLLMRFDAAESWTVSGNGIRFRNVACHEFGHMIGLEHSRVQSALMAPFYSPAVVSPQPNDDISRVQALYGPPAADVPPVPTDPKTICNWFKQITTQFNELRHAKEFTMAGITFNEADKANINALVAAATSPTCEKITAALAKLAAICPAAPATPAPAIAGGGLCAGLSGLLALLPVLQQLLAACKPTATA